MKIAILGSGGREHALAFSISKSKQTKEIYCIPGNAGTSKLAQNISIDLNDFEKIYNFLNKKKIDLVVVGPEEPLVNGIVDYLEKLNIKVFGPNKLASQLEGSKIFTKKICKKYNIPTASFGVFKNQEESNKYIQTAKHPLVIKADNLAAGKGVYICKNKDESFLAVKEIFGGKFGNAKNILFEEFLEGEEMSYFIITDGITIKNFGSAQDHKRVGEGDTGRNTGGMGAYSPSRLMNEDLEKKILKRIIEPTLKGIAELGTKYKGFLYAGLMIVNNEPYLIEYNVRMGDPECQTIVPKLNTDIVDIILSCVNELFLISPKNISLHPIFLLYKLLRFFIIIILLGAIIPPYCFNNFIFPNNLILPFIGSDNAFISIFQSSNKLPKESSSIKHTLNDFPQYLIIDSMHRFK